MHATSNQALGRQTTGFGVMATGLAIAASVAVGAVIGINLASKAAPLAGATYSLITPSAAVDGSQDAIAAAKAPFVPKDEEVALPNVVTPFGPGDVQYQINAGAGTYTGPGFDDQSYLLGPELTVNQPNISYADRVRGNAGWWASAPVATPGFDTASNAGSTYSAAANAGSSYLDGAEARHNRAMRTVPHDRPGSTFLDGADQRHNPTPAVDLSGVQRAGLD
jgi:hypothetical protein